MDSGGLSGCGALSLVARDVCSLESRHLPEWSRCAHVRQLSCVGVSSPVGLPVYRRFAVSDAPGMSEMSGEKAAVVTVLFMIGEECERGSLL